MNSPIAPSDRPWKARTRWARKSIAAGLLVLGLVLFARRTGPLSQEERTLVGTWAYRDAEESRFQRTFTADRRFREVRLNPGSIRCGGVPSGTWQIRRGELILTRDPSSLFIPSWTIRDVWSGIRRRWIDSRAERYLLARLDQNEVELDGLPYRRLPMPASGPD